MKKMASEKFKKRYKYMIENVYEMLLRKCNGFEKDPMEMLLNQNQYCCQLLVNTLDTNEKQIKEMFNKVEKNFINT